MKTLFFILLCLPAMAHGQVGTALCSNAAASGSSLTCVSASGITAGATPMLWFVEDSITSQSISGCGTTNADWKLAAQVSSSGSASLYYVENAVGSAGPCTLTMTLGASENHLSIVGTQEPGLLHAFSLDTYGPSRYDGTPTTLNVTAQQSGELIVSSATTGCNGSPGTFSSTTGSTLIAQVNGSGGNGFGVFDRLAPSAGLQTVTMQTPTPQCGYGGGLIATFNYSLPTYGRVQKNLTTCVTGSCSVTLPGARAGDIALVQPTHVGCQAISIASSNGEFMHAVPAGTGCETAPMYFVLNGGDTTITSTTATAINYLAVEELTSNLHYWNGSAFAGSTYFNPLTIYNVTGLGTCYLVAPFNLGNTATTASAGYVPLYFSSAQVSSSPTGNYVWWEQIVSGGSPYSNTADRTGTQPGVFAGLYSFCSDPSPSPQAVQAGWSGPTTTVPTQNAVIAGHSLIVHNVSDHLAVTWTLTSSPSNTWVQIGGCGVSDYFCDWIAWSAASGITTFTVPADSWQTLYQEVSGIASLRHSVYTAPATGSTSYTTGTVSATAGDYLLAFDSCQGSFTNCTPSGQNSANTWTLRNDGTWTDNTGNQAFEQIAPTTTTYALPFTLPSTGLKASSSIYDFVASPNIGIRTQMFGSAQSFGNTQAIP